MSVRFREPAGFARTGVATLAGDFIRLKAPHVTPKSLARYVCKMGFDLLEKTPTEPPNKPNTDIRSYIQNFHVFIYVRRYSSAPVTLMRKSTGGWMQ